MPVDFRDEVRNIVSGVTGTVDAIYTIGGVQYVDVICGERMFYASPVAKWEVVAKCDE